SGNGTDTTNASWSPWKTWNGPSAYLPGADHFQIRIDLNTTNASRSPVLQSVSVDTRHRVASGTVLSDVFVASSGFLRWRSFNATWSSAPRTAVVFLAGNGSSLSPVLSGGSLTTIEGPAVRWQARLSTSDGLRTPTVARVEVVYEFLGPVDHIALSP